MKHNVWKYNILKHRKLTEKKMQQQMKPLKTYNSGISGEISDALNKIKILRKKKNNL